METPPPPFLREPPYFWAIFHDPRLCPNFKNEKPPLILGGGGNYAFITWLYQSTIHLACMGFKSNNLDDILTLVGSFPFWSCIITWSANQSLYLFWMNDFAALFTDKSNGWNLLVRLLGTPRHHSYFQHTASSCIIVLPFKSVHNYQGMLL